jgi:ABC-2 type transport system ATP-binding protein
VKPVVEVKDLTVRFGNFSAVNKVSFSVQRGEIFGFLGANGAGKTTTIRVLCGLLVPSEGEVFVCGQSFSDQGNAIKSRVGYMSQKFTLYEDMTVQENLSFAASLRKIPPAESKRRQKELFDWIGWNRALSEMVRDLPGGLKQQVSLVASLLHQPEIIFLDEPTAGVTPTSRARFWDLIRSLASLGTTVFVTTHYMDEAEQCARIALMRSGELVALDSPLSLKQSAFPRGLWELTPLQGTSPSMKKWQQHPAIGLLEPYGLRYHLEITDEQGEADLKAELGAHFKLVPISPSLEDVFIRFVEGKNR